MTATGAQTFMKENWGKLMLSTIYGDFLGATTFTIDQNNPLGSIAKLHTYFEQLNAVSIEIPELVKALILVQTIHKVWEAAASKCLHDYLHELDDEDASSNDMNNNIRVSHSPVKRSGTNTPSFEQQQHPCPPQRKQQRGQQQQQQSQQQHAPPSNQDKGKKKKKQQRGMHGGIDKDAGSSGGNHSGNCPHGHFHFASVARTITPPFSSVMKHKDRVALNAIKQSLCAEITTEPNNLWAGYRPPSTWDKTYPDLNFKAASRLPSSRSC
ncbi:hypothetical protein PQX77_014660 [Marasmius sp. AFHP31]|nr:hypothetical protein PQX77_014660 [Marasmius sp. AFHP31]